MFGKPWSGSPRQSTTSHSPYSKKFWLAYLVNCSVLIAFSLTFRFAGFIESLGGHAFWAGSIVALGVIFGVTCKLNLSKLAARAGCRRLWLWATVSIGIGALILAANRHINLETALGRMLLVGGFGSAVALGIAYVQAISPVRRRNRTPIDFQQFRYSLARSSQQCSVIPSFRRSETGCFFIQWPLVLRLVLL